MNKDVVYVKNGLEWYLDPDGKLVSRPIDTYRYYRRSEIAPEILELIDQLRSKGRYLQDYNIDAIIKMQNECLEKGINYVKYRYFGKARYTDVFGAAADNHYAEINHRRQCERMEDTMNDMRSQIEEMQQLILNMAKHLTGKDSGKVLPMRRAV